MNIQNIETIPEQDRVVESAIARMLRQSREKRLKEATLPIFKGEKKSAEWVVVKDPESSSMDYSPVNGLDSIYETAEISDESHNDYFNEPIEEESLESDYWPEEDTDRFERDDEEIREEDYISYLGIPPEDESQLVDPNIVLDESQLAAIDKLVPVQYGCLIGAAGSGKTTTTKALVKGLIYRSESTFKAKRVNGMLNIAFCAFTGMAVQVIKNNLPKWLHPNCMTIHSLLEFIPQESVSLDKATGQMKVTMPFLPSRNEENLLDVDMIIIDEASMLGLDLWNQMRKACKPGTRIIMIGDLNQLPPIIGEPVFAYALSQWPVAELTHIHRQTGNAGKIVEIAHDILNGRYFADKLVGGKVDSSASKLDKMGLQKDTLMTNDEWRVSGSMLDPKIKKASPQLLATLNMLRQVKFPDGTHIYDPFRDRVMTAGNGYEENKESSLMQQYPINEALALLIQPPTDENPRYIIDGGRTTRHFAVGNRVMATRNESPTKTNRVTNGMTGVIRSIVANGEYTGQKVKFGPEQEVHAYISKQFDLMQGAKYDAAGGNLSQQAAFSASDFSIEEIDMDEVADNLAARLAEADSDEAVGKADRDTWSSHTVTVEFVNGAVREFWAKTGIESLQLAYASTVAKCQGSQFPTAVIVVHEAQTQQMSREWLYTAVTRAQGHVILLYTEYALRFCLAKQKILGRTLAEKIERYREMFEGVGGPMGGIMRKNVTLEVGN